MSPAKKKPRLYVGCSLTSASEAFKHNVEELKTVLRAEGYEIDEFVGLTAAAPRDVYLWDIKHCAAKCDIMLGICDEPSIGLGFELNEAVRLAKPVLAVAHANAHVTRMLLGAMEVERNFAFQRYENLVQDVPRILERSLPNLQEYADLVSVVNRTK